MQAFSRLAPNRHSIPDRSTARSALTKSPRGSVLPWVEAREMDRSPGWLLMRGRRRKLGRFGALGGGLPGDYRRSREGNTSEQLVPIFRELATWLIKC